MPQQEIDPKYTNLFDSTWDSDCICGHKRSTHNTMLKYFDAHKRSFWVQPCAKKIDNPMPMSSLEVWPVSACSCENFEEDLASYAKRVREKEGENE